MLKPRSGGLPGNPLAGRAGLSARSSAARGLPLRRTPLRAEGITAYAARAAIATGSAVAPQNPPGRSLLIAAQKNRARGRQSRPCRTVPERRTIATRCEVHGAVDVLRQMDGLPANPWARLRPRVPGLLNVLRGGRASLESPSARGAKSRRGGRESPNEGLLPKLGLPPKDGLPRRRGFSPKAARRSLVSRQTGLEHRARPNPHAACRRRPEEPQLPLRSQQDRLAYLPHLTAGRCLNTPSLLPTACRNHERMVDRRLAEWPALAIRPAQT